MALLKRRVLTWTDNATNEETVRVDGPTQLARSSRSRHSPPTSQLLDVTVNTNTAYSYRVLAVNGRRIRIPNQFDVTTPAAAAASPAGAPDLT